MQKFMSGLSSQDREVIANHFMREIDFWQDSMKLLQQIKENTTPVSGADDLERYKLQCQRLEWRIKNMHRIISAAMDMIEHGDRDNVVLAHLQRGLDEAEG